MRKYINFVQFPAGILRVPPSGKDMKKDHQQESYVPYVIDAVNLTAHALSNYFKNNCGRRSLKQCINEKKIEGSVLLQYIRNTTFRGRYFAFTTSQISDILPMKGTMDDVRLNEVGDRMTRYIIYQFRNIGYHRIGDWLPT